MNWIDNLPDNSLHHREKGNMNLYTAEFFSVQIKQMYPLRKNWFPYRVEITHKRTGHSYTEWTMTKWGAKRQARKLVRKVVKPSFRPKTIYEYEINEANQ